MGGRRAAEEGDSFGSGGGPFACKSAREIVTWQRLSKGQHPACLGSSSRSGG